MTLGAGLIGGRRARPILRNLPTLGVVAGSLPIVERTIARRRLAGRPG